MIQIAPTLPAQAQPLNAASAQAQPDAQALAAASGISTPETEFEAAEAEHPEEPEDFGSMLDKAVSMSGQVVQTTAAQPLIPVVPPDAFAEAASSEQAQELEGVSAPQASETQAHAEALPFTVADPVTALEFERTLASQAGLRVPIAAEQPDAAALTETEPVAAGVQLNHQVAQAYAVAVEPAVVEANSSAVTEAKPVLDLTVPAAGREAGFEVPIRNHAGSTAAPEMQAAVQPRVANAAQPLQRAAAHAMQAAAAPAAVKTAGDILRPAEIGAQVAQPAAEVMEDAVTYTRNDRGTNAREDAVLGAAAKQTLPEEAEAAPAIIAYSEVQAAAGRGADSIQSTKTAEPVAAPKQVEQIASAAQQGLVNGKRVMEIELKPEGLGSVVLRISGTADGARGFNDLRLDIQVSSPEAHSLLSKHMDELKTVLNRWDVNLAPAAQQGEAMRTQESSNGSPSQQNQQDAQRRQQQQQAWQRRESQTGSEAFGAHLEAATDE